MLRLLFRVLIRIRVVSLLAGNLVMHLRNVSWALCTSHMLFIFSLTLRLSKGLGLIRVSSHILLPSSLIVAMRTFRQLVLVPTQGAVVGPFHPVRIPA